eukprot:CAMPEP_0194275986 /NCGR_PEP_ID=MMETSP0169-20130528/8689_1 /TAXON_ID=218684 /ORGANISM="Corethron pennatum, Strain L29A3" /LENGTH=63 /DNA_ID=CAMNT_0039019595 /DNA_START=74 /DNA_END=262 /DNA_ORIENTATION=-
MADVAGRHPKRSTSLLVARELPALADISSLTNLDLSVVQLGCDVSLESLDFSLNNSSALHLSV